MSFPDSGKEWERGGLNEGKRVNLGYHVNGLKCITDEWEL